MKGIAYAPLSRQFVELHRRIRISQFPSGGKVQTAQVAPKAPLTPAPLPGPSRYVQLSARAQVEGHLPVPAKAVVLPVRPSQVHRAGTPDGRPCSSK